MFVENEKIIYLFVEDSVFVVIDERRFLRDNFFIFSREVGDNDSLYLLEIVEKLELFK